LKAEQDQQEADVCAANVVLRELPNLLELSLHYAVLMEGQTTGRRYKRGAGLKTALAVQRFAILPRRDTMLRKTTIAKRAALEERESRPPKLRGGYLPIVLVLTLKTKETKDFDYCSHLANALHRWYASPNEVR
jgi:hypothetical protein